MSPEVTADSVDALAHACASRGSLRSALIAWCDTAPEQLAKPLERLAARLRIGAPISYALSDLRPHLGIEADVLIAIVKLHLSTGADPVALLVAQASRIRADEGMRRRGAAGLAGIRASARLIAGLPIACLLLLPMESSPVSDPLGVALVCGGVILSAAGLVWIRRAIPADPTGRERVATVCDLMAGALRAGSTVAAALEVALCALDGPERTRLERVQRLMRLGSRLPHALELAGGEDLRALAGAIDRATAAGTPLAPGLEAHAAWRRERAVARAEAAMQRAPVKMLPALALCVLPAFMLLGLGPFVRELFASL